MPDRQEHRHLIKFLLGSASFFFIGTVHGVVQVLPPVRAWLDAVGSPIAGPGHMIDPLAHAHMNVVGGLVILGMAMTYYLLPTISGRPLHSRRLATHSFWWTAIGVCGFYTTLLVFGIIEGNLMLTDPAAVPAVHHYYAPVISLVSTVMGMGFWIFFANVFLTVKDIYRQR
jgi:cytochrome c oxidase cbb3-type subunit 1